MLTVEVEEVVLEDLAEEGRATEPHILRGRWRESVAAVVDGGMDALWHVHVTKRHPANHGFTKEQVSTYREHHLQGGAYGAQQMPLI